MMKCDPVTGACLLPDPDKPTDAAALAMSSDLVLYYIGDPMCSWCWGIAPLVANLPAYCDERGADFSIVAGGLRPGGGDPWNAQFKDFLRHHWTDIGRITGQPFSLDLLDREDFHYDTEPPCRAVVVARTLLSPRNDNQRSLVDFFAALQRAFYVGSGDPGQLAFYRDPCLRVGLDFDVFAQRFAGDDARRATQADFQLSRSWGVRGFPSFALRQGAHTQVIASGHVDLATLNAGIERALDRTHAR